jgi:hypothetical protein
MQLQQLELASGNDRMICWLPFDRRVREGVVISLAKSDRRWRVLKQYSAIQSSDLRRGWKVGGLS